MIKTAIVATTLLASGLAVLPASASTPVNWGHRTCAAFSAWEKHPSGYRLNALMTDSEHVPWKYLGEDVATLYVKARSGKNQDVARTYVYEDCTNGSGL